MMSVLLIKSKYIFVIQDQFAQGIFTEVCVKNKIDIPRGVPRKTCSENMQQIYRRTPMPKCVFNKFALQLY